MSTGGLRRKKDQGPKKVGEKKVSNAYFRSNLSLLTLFWGVYRLRRF
jgi:hypothetical protein